MISPFLGVTETFGKRNRKREMPWDKALFLITAEPRTALS